MIDSRCYAENTINVITISGGKDSLAQWLLAIENGVKYVAVFADTGHEHPQTMEYLDYLESHLGNIQRVTSRGGRQFDLLADENAQQACSSVYAGVCE
ncbi:hypothetical protein Xentx_03598 [Xenorhabdus thuongxuanensis]|uniref:Phosphoadenosine phosphosulphate reductase domain-containing protein n=1 Tax=Xenorhabdus thuongxuanensis TaxID=1873484 RepID=A0A1Q5TH18_9GAMM|nr:hypothetical protein Xentx_03598 [Xenorhabdus thuongxuanensis]